MIRRLVFDDTERGKNRFTILYQGFNAGGQAKWKGEPTKPMAATRLECRVLDVLDAISEPAPNGTPNAIIMRALKDGGGTADLNQQQYDMLRMYFESAASAWLPIAARHVVDVADWLAAAPVIEDEPSLVAMVK